MYFKFIIFLAIVIIGGLLYLHTMNPGEVDFILAEGHSYAVPVTLLLFAGFTIGVVLTIANSIVIDTVKGLRGMRTRRQMRQLADAQDNYRKGVEALAGGEIRLARKHLEKAVAVVPDDGGMVISLAETYKREGRLAGALEVLENGALKSPASTGIHLAIAKSSEEAGDLLKASMALEDVLRLDPGNPYALKTLRDIKVRQKAWSEAAAYQRKLIDSSRDDGAKGREKTLLAAIIYEDAAGAAEDGRLDEATTLARESLRHDSTFMPSDILTAEILYRRGKVVEALSVLEDSLGKYGEPYPLLLKIEDLYIKKSAPDKALDRYRKEVYTHPGDIRMRQLLSRLYLRLEMLDQAIEELERLYSESSEDYYTRVLLAAAYLRSGEADRAALLFAKALMLEGDLAPVFMCSACDSAAGQWAARCPACGGWNTLEMGGPRQRGTSVSRMMRA